MSTPKELQPYPYKEYPVMQKPSLFPTEGQQAQINRKYGMFLHFGIYTFTTQNGRTGPCRLKVAIRRQ